MTKGKIKKIKIKLKEADFSELLRRIKRSGRSLRVPDLEVSEQEFIENLIKPNQI